MLPLNTKEYKAINKTIKYWEDNHLDIDIKKIDNLKRYIESLCK